jgi:hypothetical protein
MSQGLINLDDILKWLESKRGDLPSGVALVDIRSNIMHTATASADFESPDRQGRISGWDTGEFDFEVLRVADYGFAFFKHEHVSDIRDPVLDDTFRGFIESMAGQDV